MKRNNILIMNEFDGQGLIQTVNNELHVLNSTTLEIYKMIEEKSMDEIINYFTEKFKGTSINEIKKDIDEIINEMIIKGIILENE